MKESSNNLKKRKNIQSNKEVKNTSKTKKNLKSESKPKENYEKTQTLEEEIYERKNNDYTKMLEKKVKNRKIVIIILSIIIILGLLGETFLAISYVYKDAGVYYKTYHRLKNYKERVKINYLDKRLPYIENVHNATNKLNLVSAYGDNHAIHPKVIYFNEKWNGYKYWMVYSPYPFSDDSKENPHIKVSNDLITWTEPEGLKNPLADTPEDYENMVIYYSDPHLVYNSDKDIIECYFRRVDDKADEMILYRMVSKDGVHWSDKEEIIKTQRSKHDYVSPAIIYEDHMYKIWYVNKNNTVTYEESKDGYTYENSRVLDIKYSTNSLKTWHLDVISTDLGYEMIAVAYNNWEDRNSMELYYFQSKDNVNWSTGRSIISPSNVSWDNRGLYRSSFIKMNGVYYVYYSGISRKYSRGIGLSYGKDIDNLIGSNTEKVLDKE